MRSEGVRDVPACCLALLSLLVQTAQGGPADAVSAAAADAAKLPPEVRKHVRYLSLYAVPAKEREDFKKALAFHCNSLSRESELYLPTKVNDELLRINLLDYEWKRETWEKLAGEEPYYHLRVKAEKVAVKKPAEAVHGKPELERVSYDRGRTWVWRRKGGAWGEVHEGGKTADEVKEAKEVVAHAPWLPAKEITALALMLNSDAPIVRADWFLYQTAIQKDRKVGYYDMVGLGEKESDFQELIGADVKLAKKVKREMAAAIDVSGVTTQNRGVERYDTINGPYYRTQDFKKSIDQQNVLKFINGTAEPPQGDASEQYGTLPNGLFAFGLFNAKGERADTAPDFIAGDSRSGNNDHRVHVGLSCVRCHDEGIKPIDDWVRRVYRGPLQLSSKDYEALKQLRRKYLSDLEGKVLADQKAYAAVLLKLNGMTPKENARAYAKAYSGYAETGLALEDAARELGVGAKEFRKALADYAADPKGTADPLLASLLIEPPVRLRREHWEEVYAIAQTVMRGGRP
jgi:hypothetical protein